MSPPAPEQRSGEAQPDVSALLGGRYRLLERIGGGANAEVFAAFDVEQSRGVALKIVADADPQLRRQLVDEFEALASLRHRNLASALALFVDGDRLCYAMELVEGRPWAEHHARLVADPALLAQTLLQLVDVVETIHASARVHGDLSHTNVLLDVDDRLVVIDPIGRTAITVGTPIYMAPELFTGAAPSRAADWYAVGALGYECLTGAPPFDERGPDAVIAAKRRAVAPVALPALPQLADAIAQLLTPDPTRRGDGSTLRRALSPEPIVPVSPPTPGPLIGRRHELAWLHQRLGDTIASSRLQVAVVRSPSGAGKSHALATFCAELRRERTAFALSARCIDADTRPTRMLGGLLDDLAARATHELTFSIERCYPRHASELIACFPATATLFSRGTAERPRGEIEPAVTQELASRAAADVLGRLSEHVPLVVWIDDIQHSDTDGNEALLRLLLALSESPVLCLLACSERATGPDAGLEALLAGCRRHLGDARVIARQLEPLPREQLLAIAWNQLESWPGSAELVEAICSGARGNPGLCVWLARALRLLELDALPAGSDEALVRSVFEGLWRRLSDDSRRLSCLLALAGADLPIRTARALVSDPQRGSIALRELEHYGFVAPITDGVVTLRHERVAELLHGLADPTQLPELHLALAEALTDGASASLGLRAAHLLAAGALPRAREAFSRAAADARREHAHHRAVELLGHALELESDDAALRRELELALADSLIRLGRLREAAELSARLARGDALDSAVTRALHRRSIGAFGALAEVESVKALLHEGLGWRPGAASSSALVRLVALRLRIAARPPWRRPAAVHEPDAAAEHELDLLWIAGARLLHLEPILAAYLISRHMLLCFRVGSVPHQARALAFEAVMLTSSGDRRITSAATVLASAERRAQQCGDPAARAAVHLGAGFMWGNVARYREAIEEGRRSLEALAMVSDLPGYELAHAQMELGWRLLMVGEYREVLVIATAALRDALACEDPVLSTAFHVQLANAHLAADHRDDCQAHIEAAERGCPTRFAVGQFGIFLARIAQHLYLGDPERALAHLHEHGPHIESLRILELPAVRTIYHYRVGAMLTHVAALGTSQQGSGLHKRLERARSRVEHESFEVAVAHARLLAAHRHGLAGAIDVARGNLREAIDRFAALGWNTLAATANLRYCTLQGTGNAAAAREHLVAVGVADPLRWASTLLPALP